jgi:superfamily II DNA/RNA helicase
MMMAAQDFARLGLSDWLIQQCHSVGFKSPTPVQEHCIPSILQGIHLQKKHIASSAPDGFTIF